MELSDLIFLIFEVFIGFLAIIENSFLLFVNIKNNFFNNRVYYLIASQSLAALLTGFLVIPSEIVLLNDDIKIDHYPCLFVFLCVTSIISVSKLSVLCIGIDQFMAVKYHWKYHPIRNSMPTAAIVLCWVIGLSPGLLLFVWNAGEETECTLGENSKLTNGYFFFRHILFAVIPLVCLIIIFTVIVAKLKKKRLGLESYRTSDRRPSPPIQSLPSQAQTVEEKTTTSLFIIITVFTMCWIPRTVYHLYDNICGNCIYKNYEYLIKIVFILSHMPTVINPLIYAFRIERFKNAIVNIFRKPAVGLRCVA